MRLTMLALVVTAVLLSSSIYASAQAEDRTCIVCEELIVRGQAHKHECDVRLDKIQGGPAEFRGPITIDDLPEKLKGLPPQSQMKVLAAMQKERSRASRARAKDWHHLDADVRGASRFDYVTTIFWSANIVAKGVRAVQGESQEWALVRWRVKVGTRMVWFQLASRDLFAGNREIDFKTIKRDLLDRGIQKTISRSQLEALISKRAKDLGGFPEGRGQQISAQEAVEQGLIYKCVDDDALGSELDSLVQTLIKHPAQGLALNKRALLSAASHHLQEQLLLEAQLQTIAGRSDDYKEAVCAFVEKREARFSGA